MKPLLEHFNLNGGADGVAGYRLLRLNSAESAEISAEIHAEWEGISGGDLVRTPVAVGANFGESDARALAGIRDGWADIPEQAALAAALLQVISVSRCHCAFISAVRVLHLISADLG